MVLIFFSSPRWEVVRPGSLKSWEELSIILIMECLKRRESQKRVLDSSIVNVFWVKPTNQARGLVSNKEMRWTVERGEFREKERTKTRMREKPMVTRGLY